MPGVLSRALMRPLSVINYRTSPRTDRTSAVVQSQRRVMKSNPRLYRDWSQHAPFVRTAMDIRLGQLVLAEWDLVPFDRDGRTLDKGLVRRIRELLQQPNPSGESFGTVLWAIGEDILALDAGGCEKERMLNDEIAYLWPTDGAKIAVDRLWDGNPRDPRYYWVPQPNVEVPLLNRDLIYMMIHKRSYEPVGISYLETLKYSIEAELSGSMFNARSISQAAPDGVIDLGENARPEQVSSFESYFRSELAGRGMLGFWGGTKGAKFIPFKGSNREAQFMEYLLWEASKVAIVFQLSPQDIGLLHDVNRANAEVQQENTEDRGARTFLAGVENYLTTEVCWDDRYGGKRNNIAFRFRAVSDRASLRKAQELRLALAGMPWESINGARIAVGLPPIGDPNDEANPFNKLMANTPLGLATIDFVPNAKDLVANKAPAEGEPKVSKPNQAQIGPGKSYTLSDPLLSDEQEAGMLRTLGWISDAANKDVNEANDLVLRTIEKSDARIESVLGQFTDAVKALSARPIDIQVHSPVNLPEGMVKVESPVHIAEGAVQVNLPTPVPKTSRIKKTVERDPTTHEIKSVTEEEVE